MTAIRPPSGTPAGTQDLKLPHSITVDMGKSHRIGGFTYLPRQDGKLNGVVEKYRFETSADGTNWTTNIASGSFANIRNNPSLQEVSFAPVNARLLPLHRLAGDQPQRLDERRRNLRPAGQRGWWLTMWHSVTTSDNVPPRSWSKIWQSRRSPSVVICPRCLESTYTPCASLVSY